MNFFTSAETNDHDITNLKEMVQHLHERLQETERAVFNINSIGDDDSIHKLTPCVVHKKDGSKRPATLSEIHTAYSYRKDELLSKYVKAKRERDRLAEFNLRLTQEIEVLRNSRDHLQETVNTYITRFNALSL